MKNAVVILVLLLLGTQKSFGDQPLKAPPPINTLVVCPLEFQPEMKRWIQHRESQGHGIVMIRPSLDSQSQKLQIRQLAKRYPLKHLLLVGDCYAKKINAFHNPPLVPRGTVRAVVNVRFRSEPIICTDNVYADLDDDLIPELTVGRLSADTTDELKGIISKILDYERNPVPGSWKRKINLVAGVGGFGSLTDKIIEAAARQIIVKGIPPEFETCMTHASWRSPYCPDPRSFHDVTLERLNEGCLYWVYFGHGHIHQLDQVNTPISRFKILNVYDKSKFAANNGPPIAVLLACYTGAMDAIDDCLAEEMLESPGGPVAVFAGSRVTMPYAMSVLSHEMLIEMFQGDPDTLGELILNAKRRMANSKGKRDATRTAIDAMAGLFSPTRDLMDEERLEHVQLFNLLGDPLLKLPKSNDLPIQIPSRVYPGSTVRITGKSPHPGKLTIELFHERGKLSFTPKSRKEFKWSYEFLNQLQEEYRIANRNRIKQTSFEVEQGNFQVEFKVPKVQGKFQIRAFLENRHAFAVGSSDIKIR